MIQLLIFTNFYLALKVQILNLMKKKKILDSRREFLKSASLASAGFMIVPRHVLGGKGFLAPSDKLVVAGIGAGGKG